jgi:hypothetical protein
MPSLDRPGASPDLDEALLRVEQADRRLLSSAELGYRRARSAAVASAVALGIGAVLIGTLAGSSGRRRLASGVLGFALPFLASAVADVARHIRLPEREERTSATGFSEIGSAPARGVPAGSIPGFPHEAQAAQGALGRPDPLGG